MIKALFTILAFTLLGVSVYFLYKIDVKNAPKRAAKAEARCKAQTETYVVSCGDRDHEIKATRYSNNAGTFSRATVIEFFGCGFYNKIGSFPITCVVRKKQ